MFYNNLICPITKQIFCNPVALEDGHTYEYIAIKKWLNENEKSPVTNEIIVNFKLSVNYTIKSIVEEYLKNNPDKKNEQYSHYQINNNLINFNYNDFENLTINEQKKYLDNCIDLECEGIDKWRPIHFICRFSKPEIIKYIIDKDVNLECETIQKWRPIHLICRHSTPK